jgi:anthranilate synthase/aminodeoxychorismate synthase-like glutamine amidotransferase
MIVLIDNYDSFVHNLARYFRRLGQATLVVRNDAVDLNGIRALRPRGLAISPGPCTPNEAGISLDVVRELAGELPLLGVCLGHQVIVQAFGGEIVRAPEPVHGRASLVCHDNSPLFSGIGNPFSACRYHSLVASRDSLPPGLHVTAWTDDGTIMAVQHGTLPVYGLQFHPESVLTRDGLKLLSNFTKLIVEGHMDEASAAGKRQSSR